MNIIFYNKYHNGDIHVSRGFISKFCHPWKGSAKAVSQFHEYGLFYSHKNDPCLTEDLKLIKHLTDFKNTEENKLIHTYENNVVLNTWYRTENNKYIQLSNGINFDCLYFIFKDIFSYFGINIEDISEDPLDFFPSVNFDYINTKNIDEFNSNNKITILACNNETMSSQSSNFDFSKIFLQLAKIYTDKIWILTNHFNFDRDSYPNVLFASEIIKKENGSDLNEISYLSTKCDVIIGRASGPFTFAINRQNIEDPNKTLLSFSRLGTTYDRDSTKPSNHFWLGEWGEKHIQYKANVKEFSEEHPHKVFEIIKKLLS